MRPAVLRLAGSSWALLSGGPLVETLFCQQCGQVVQVQAVAHARSNDRPTDDRRDAPVAVVVSGNRIEQDADGIDNDRTTSVAGQRHNLVAVLRLASISVVHGQKSP